MRSSHKWIPATVLVFLLLTMTPIESGAFPAADDNLPPREPLPEIVPRPQLQKQLPERGSIAILAATSKSSSRHNSRDVAFLKSLPIQPRQQPQQSRLADPAAPRQEVRRKSHKWIVIAAAAVGAGIATTLAVRGQNGPTVVVGIPSVGDPVVVSIPVAGEPQ